MKIAVFVISIVAVLFLVHALLIALSIALRRNLLFTKKYSAGTIWDIFLLSKILIAAHICRKSLLLFVIRLNNALVKALNKTKSTEVLVLLPRCLQHQSCSQAVAEKIQNCKSCGKCDLANIKIAGKDSPPRILVATGGEIAVRYVAEYKPDFVVAVACARELFQGLVEISKVPVYAVLNEQPEGPCKNTRVDPAAVEYALSLAQSNLA